MSLSGESRPPQSARNLALNKKLSKIVWFKTWIGHYDIDQLQYCDILGHIEKSSDTILSPIQHTHQPCHNKAHPFEADLAPKNTTGTGTQAVNDPMHRPGLRFLGYNHGTCDKVGEVTNPQRPSNSSDNVWLWVNFYTYQ